MVFDTIFEIRILYEVEINLNGKNRAVGSKFGIECVDTMSRRVKPLSFAVKFQNRGTARLRENMRPFRNLTKVVFFRPFGGKLIIRAVAGKVNAVGKYHIRKPLRDRLREPFRAKPGRNAVPMAVIPVVDFQRVTQISIIKGVIIRRSKHIERIIDLKVAIRSQPVVIPYRV